MAAFETWYEPHRQTTMIADGVVSTIGAELFGAASPSAGKSMDSFYSVPEVQAFAADDNYQQYRAGVHLTGLHTGARMERRARLGRRQRRPQRALRKLGL